MQGVCRKAKSNNAVLLAVVFKFSRDVAFMAVKNKHLICSLLPNLSMHVKMLNPFKAYLIVCLAV